MFSSVLVNFATYTYLKYAHCHRQLVLAIDDSITHSSQYLYCKQLKKSKRFMLYIPKFEGLNMHASNEGFFL